MKVGDEFRYEGAIYRVERERGDYSCEGCALMRRFSGKIGCMARSKDKVFDSCKRDRIIFVSLIVM